MSQNIADIRKEYSLRNLDGDEVSKNPFQQFDNWFAEALHSEVAEPNAMHLSTIGENGRPNGRIVLLKGTDARGFLFFTNYRSVKGRELTAHPVAALTFFWPEMERQIRLQGTVEKVSVMESDAYFSSRPRGSQVGAWVSEQSKAIAGREVLEAAQAAVEQQFKGQPVPRPPHWGGFRLLPDSFEFWQGRPSRLHDRIAYTLNAAQTWEISRLSP